MENLRCDPALSSTYQIFGYSSLCVVRTWDIYLCNFSLFFFVLSIVIIVASTITKRSSRMASSKRVSYTIDRILEVCRFVSPRCVSLLFVLRLLLFHPSSLFRGKVAVASKIRRRNTTRKKFENGSISGLSCSKFFSRSRDGPIL